MSTVTVDTTGAVDVVTVIGEGPRGVAGPLGDWLGVLTVTGKPGTGEVVLDVIPNEALILGADLAGWYIAARVEANDEAIGHVYVNDIEVGTYTWQQGDTVPALATTGNAAVPIGALDRLTVALPEPADDTLADISIRIRAARA